MREKIEVLETHANFAADLFNMFQIICQLHAVNDDLSLLVLFQAVDTADQG